MNQEVSGNIIINKEEGNINIVEQQQEEEEDYGNDVPITYSQSNNVSSVIQHNVVPEKQNRFSMMFKAQCDE